MAINGSIIVNGKTITAGDVYKMALGVTSLLIMVCGQLHMGPEWLQHAMITVGAVSAAVHALLLDTRVLDILRVMFGGASDGSTNEGAK